MSRQSTMPLAFARKTSAELGRQLKQHKVNGLGEGKNESSIRACG